MTYSQAQYEFVYEALLEALECGDTAIPCSSFTDKYRELCDAGANGDSLSVLETQFGVNYVLLNGILYYMTARICLSK